MNKEDLFWKSEEICEHSSPRKGRSQACKSQKQSGTNTQEGGSVAHARKSRQNPKAQIPGEKEKKNKPRRSRAPPTVLLYVGDRRRQREARQGNPLRIAARAPPHGPRGSAPRIALAWPRAPPSTRSPRLGSPLRSRRISLSSLLLLLGTLLLSAAESSPSSPFHTCIYTRSPRLHLLAATAPVVCLLVHSFIHWQEQEEES